MQYAFYTVTKKMKFVTISAALCGSEFAAPPRFPVTGKAEARKIAATHNPKPWNF